ncbi:MAG TPA: hypothetical protein VIK89_12015 [Cytophagaceae bacterium]
MKKLFLKAVSIAIVLLLSACKEDVEIFPDDSLEQTSGAIDDAIIQSESEQLVEEANRLLAGVSGFNGGKITELPGVCGGTVEWSDTTEKKITVVFDGSTDCLGRKRWGKILVELKDSLTWESPLASAVIYFTDYKVARADEKSITINGTQTVINEIGFTVDDLDAGITENLIYIIRGEKQITFDNGKTCTWYSALRRLVTKIGSDYSIELSGDTILGNLDNVAVWGDNRNGKYFYSQIIEPIHINSCASSTPGWIAVSGKKTHKGSARETSITFGVDQSGNAINTCEAYGYLVNWTNLEAETEQIVVRY